MDVVKIGGSLLEELPGLAPVLGAMDALVVPGGGPFSDAVRRVDRRIGLSPLAAHRMAILGMEQYGWLVSHQTGIPLTADPRAPRPAVFLPARWLEREDPFSPSWEVTSDSIAAWLAHRLGLHRVVLLKRGATSFHRGDGSPRELEAWELGGSELVDQELPRCLERWQLKAMIVDGSRPDQWAHALGAGTRPPAGEVAELAMERG